MKKITPHLWFDKEAKEAAEFYTSIFPNSKINNVTTIHNTPAPNGDCDIISFELENQPFMSISAGPIFKFNPAISFMLHFNPTQDAKAKEKLNTLWNKLAEGGKALMPLEKYPFSELYGWVHDKYGVSWQLMLSDSKSEDQPRPFIMPSLMFVGTVTGLAAEAIDYYVSVFKKSAKGHTAYYDAEHAPNKEGTVMYADFMLNGQWFAAMDSAHPHDFFFNEAVSLLIPCDSQEEIDYYWDKLSNDPTAEQCGWLKDQYGVSWQIWPTLLGEMMSQGTPEQVDRVTQAFLQMKKYDIAKLNKAFSAE